MGEKGFSCFYKIDMTIKEGTYSHGTIGGWKICECKEGECPFILANTMPFKDLPEGQTHSFDDGCDPAHEMPQHNHKS